MLAEKQRPGMAKMDTQLDEGPVTITWPDTLSKESYEEFVYWLDGVKRRAARKAGIPRKKTQTPLPLRNSPGRDISRQAALGRLFSCASSDCLDRFSWRKTSAKTNYFKLGHNR